MNSDTQQFVYKIMAGTVCLALLIILCIDGGAIFFFGDGEALNLIQQLNAPLVAAFSVLGGATVGHQLISFVFTRLLGSGASVALPSANPGQSAITQTLTQTLTQTPQPAPIVAPEQTQPEGGI